MYSLRAAAVGKRGRGVRAEDKRLSSAPEQDSAINHTNKKEREGDTSLYTAANATAYVRAQVRGYKMAHWVFQQDSAPALRAKSTQDWLAAREIDFIRHEDWPSSSPDLNPLDYKIWQHLEEKACSKPHPNLESQDILD
ncbi:unnamed protein product [Parnassius mnemosyne]|uniref:Tc1-like transposase DDE domain-containing protein n=1 Tax=Parnassius mnemosyne TaxID=213953 RepID=A0AAV1LH87_9NEOP